MAQDPNSGVELNTVPLDLWSRGTVFSDLSVKSIVIPPASTGTTAISRAAVQS